jgi:hypothetical protein
MIKETKYLVINYVHSNYYRILRSDLLHTIPRFKRKLTRIIYRGSKDACNQRLKEISRQHINYLRYD